LRLKLGRRQSTALQRNDGRPPFHAVSRGKDGRGGVVRDTGFEQVDESFASVALRVSLTFPDKFLTNWA